MVGTRRIVERTDHSAEMLLTSASAIEELRLKQSEGIYVWIY